MEAFLRMKAVLYGRFTRLQASLESSLSPATAASHLRDWSEMFSTIDKNYTDIFKTCASADLDDYVQELDDIATEYRAFRDKIELLTLSQFLPSQASCASPAHSTASATMQTPAPFELRPPRMDLPTFNGDGASWPAFSTLFTDGVNAYPSLTSSQKLLLLNSSLTGPAKNVVSYIPPSPTAFQEAWDLLKKKYEATREISYSLVNKILQLPNAVTCQQLEHMVDTIREVRRALSLLGQAAHPSQHVYLNSIILTKLDSATLFAWQQTHKNSVDIPSTDELLDFLQSWGQNRKDSAPAAKQQPAAAKQPPMAKQYHNPPRTSCPHCKLDHFLYKCPSFLKATVAERMAIVRKIQYCPNCISVQHKVTSCPSGSCRNCGQRHHSLLHTDKPAESKALVSAAATATTHVLLATAVVQVKDSHGNLHKVRAFFDPGAQISLISQKCMDGLRLPQEKSALNLVLAAGQCSQVNFSTDMNIVTKNRTLPVTALVVDKIGINLPSVPVPRDTVRPLLRNKKLADPNFDVPAPVDILLGAPECAKLYRQKTQKFHDVLAQDTDFGWVLIGSVRAPSTPKTHGKLIAYTALQHFQRFWELEELPTTPHLTPEERAVEDFFQATTTRNPFTGRFTVRLPFKEDPPNLGHSRTQAAARLKSLENRFKKDENYAMLYREVMNEYLSLGHMEVADPASTQYRTCYLPHHAVQKKGATTSQLRVVFDASAITSSGKSLNQCQSNGPRLQKDIFAILVRFRSHPVALTADIVKMYRQIEVAEEDRDLQRILWRPHPGGPVTDYRLTTVTFGQKVAPYLAMKVLQTIATDLQPANPALSNVILNDFYVDDLLSGCNTAAQASALQHAISTALSEAGLTTHKWASNKPEALLSLDQAQQTSKVLFNMPDDTDQQKTLGVLWDTIADSFTVVTDVAQKNPKSWTRRSILSAANSFYDPLGWFSPVTITAKIFMQKIIQQTTNWDEKVSTQDAALWLNWISSLAHLSKISIPRCLTTSQAPSLILCGFSDASEKAYSACVYAKPESPDQSDVRLVAAKTKVVPLKPITLPRLELLGAVLLAKLMHTISSELNVHIQRQYAYTDSTITLAWIRGHPSKWQTFVANRVAEVQDLVPASQWSHVLTTDNPADLPSRGIPADTLHSQDLWWHGPPWLQHGVDSGSNPVSVQPPEVKRSAVIAAIAPVSSQVKTFMLKHSLFNKMRRVLAYVFLFAENKLRKTGTTLQPQHFHSAETMIFKWVQQETFSTEIAALALKKPVSLSSTLAPLNPFIDGHGVLRAAGRLQNSPTLSYDAKNPVIMPAKHVVTTMIIRSYHIQHLHAGPTLLQSLLRQKYWIPRATNLIKSLIRQCVTCTRARGQLAHQMMADLPKPRVTPVSRPFTNCGVDYAGPVMLKTQLQRSTKTYKAYIAVFVCFSTRALHLELVTSLTTEGFLSLLSRMTSRRGLPQSIFSDNGTNLVGGSNELKKLYSREVASAVAETGCQFHFNPPAAPHFGGLWEAGVKSVKTHLRRVVGSTTLTYEEFSTVLCKIEAALNSRPLTPISDDPNDLTALTPAHFLIHGPLQSFPEDDLTGERLNTLKRWQLVQRLAQDFWARWSKEYLSRLQQRPKWWRKAANIDVGALVLIQDPNRPPLDWRMGRVTAIHPGKDGAVRVVTLKTAFGEMQRPIQKLCRLPLDGTDE